MLYSLLSRYQGALCGTALAGGTIHQLSPTTLPHREWHGKDCCVTIDPTYGNPQTLPGSIVAALIQHGQSGLDLLCDDGRCQPKSQIECWMSLIPLALFFHEDREKFRQVLGKLATALQLPSSFVDRAGIVGYTISRILDETFNGATLIPQILNDSQSIGVEPELAQQLATLQTLLDRGASLEETQILFARRRSTPPQNSTDDRYSIALALYCFLSTPEDLPLSLRRSWRLQDRSPVVALLTAAFSGTYNGYGGIPAPWRMATDERIRQLALRLYASWAGVCDASQTTSESWLPVVRTPKKL
ncbi:MAG: ADP-ribosylglycohydrolase family protein [Geitlerinemataceae cyanobacterium]